MAEFPTGQERLLKQIISGYRCQVCRRRGFDEDQVRFAAQHDQVWLVTARCGYCRHRQRFWVMPSEDGDDRLLRDLTADEEERFAEMDPVTGDDVLDMHLFLGEFDGDFRRLFGR